MTASLYERLGSADGITKITSDLVDNHLVNTRIATRFANADVGALKKAAADFVITGTGGPEIYTGKDMLAVHSGMNIDSDEFMAVMDDALAAMEKNNNRQHEQEENMSVLYSMRSQVMRG